MQTANQNAGISVREQADEYDLFCSEIPFGPIGFYEHNIEQEKKTFEAHQPPTISTFVELLLKSDYNPARAQEAEHALELYQTLSPFMDGVDLVLMRRQYRDHVLSKGFSRDVADKALNRLTVGELIKVQKPIAIANRRKLYAETCLRAAERALEDKRLHSSAEETVTKLIELAGVMTKQNEDNKEIVVAPTLLFSCLAIIDWFIYGRTKTYNADLGLSFYAYPGAVLQMKPVVDIIIGAKLSPDRKFFLTPEEDAIFDKAALRINGIYKIEQDGKDQFDYILAALRSADKVGDIILPKTELDAVTLDVILKSVGLYQEIPTSVNDYTSAVPPTLFTQYQAANEELKKSLLAMYVEVTGSVVIPIYQESHWSCLIIDGPEHTAYYLDSFQIRHQDGDQPRALKEVQDFAEAIRVHRQNVEEDQLSSSFEFVNDLRVKTPYNFIEICGRQQQNKADSGFFMLDAIMTCAVSAVAFENMAKNCSQHGVLADKTHPVDVANVRKACFEYMSGAVKAQTFVDQQQFIFKFVHSFKREAIYLGKRNQMVSLPSQDAPKRQKL